MRTALNIATETPKKAIETIINNVSIKSIPSKDIKTKKDKKTKHKDNLNLKKIKKMIIFIKKLFDSFQRVLMDFGSL
jgi:hypothetical protein